MQKLTKLIAENPDLPIIALVNSNICMEGNRYWMGNFSAASIECVGLIGEHGYDDRESFIEDYYDKYSEELCEKFNYDPQCCGVNVDRGLFTQEQFAANCLAEEELDKYLNEIANKYMKKCIVVYVDEPNMSEWEVA